MIGGMCLAHLIKETQQIPMLIINGAVGGTSITQHQRDSTNLQVLMDMIYVTSFILPQEISLG